VAGATCLRVVHGLPLSIWTAVAARHETHSQTIYKQQLVTDVSRLLQGVHREPNKVPFA
jgi:hypothetical protein